MRQLQPLSPEPQPSRASAERQIFGFDAFTPKEIAQRVEKNGVIKARLPFLPMAMLGIVAGGFIGLGAMYYTLVISDAELGFAASRVLGGVAFTLGLILVVMAGAELFTGNNFLVMAWAEGQITTSEVVRNWLVVYFTNAFGAIALAIVIFLSHYPDMNDGNVGRAAIRLAAYKASLPFWTAFFKGVLCNMLVCLGLWVAMAGRSVTDKILAMIFPISAFVACGYEHCIANLYIIPLGILLANFGALPPGIDVSSLGVAGLLSNLVPVTLGNIVGGSVLVGLVYYAIYRKGLRS
ncbi:MAG: formate/nitrite transporter family protein [Betaproteobacteria bacterium]|nr:formate/nitrite transporter family protein [Betaproteobacteria bacterium]